MTRKSKIELVVDGIKFTSEGSEVQLCLNGLPVYNNAFDSAPTLNPHGKSLDFEAIDTAYALRIMNTMFGNIERYKLINSLKLGPQSFTDLQNHLCLKPPTLDFHLRKLLTEMVIYKNNDKKYELTVIGTEFLAYFTDFLNTGKDDIKSQVEK